MKKELKLTYLKKSKKFLDKHRGVLSESEVDVLIVKFIKSKIIDFLHNLCLFTKASRWVPQI